MLLLTLKQPPNPYNDREWLREYEHTIDTVFLTWMQHYTDLTQGEQELRQFIQPYLLEPWHKSILAQDMHKTHTLTPNGIRQWLHNK